MTTNDEKSEANDNTTGYNNDGSVHQVEEEFCRTIETEAIRLHNCWCNNNHQ